MRKLKSWQKLEEHFSSIKNEEMRDMFANDPERFNKYSLMLDDILYDYSKNRINDQTLKLLLELAEEVNLSTWIKKLFKGEPINHTENRAVLHMALRTQSSKPVKLDGVNILPDIHYERERVKQLAEKIRTRQWRGATNQSITDVVNIGIGGSHLGPQMVYEALKPYTLHDINIHYVSNVDANHINDTLVYLNPETTLFIISSKTFTTQDTMVNAQTAKKWYLNKMGSEEFIHRHFCAVTSNIPLAKQFGINEGNIFKMWDWVGGRYSIWSSISLSIVIAIGSDNFEQLLVGADEVDQHFQDAPLEKNIPVIMALLGIWYNNFFASETIAILPYDQHLHRFPAYLQQADMESNGKSVDRHGKQVDYSTGPILFGEIGISAQHAFFQLLHQGTKLVPCDILAPIYNMERNLTHHQALMSNVFAQTEAMMKGRSEKEVTQELKAQGLNAAQIKALLPYKIFPGNRPTSTFIFDTLNPKILGSLIALYEHKIFVQGIIWEINSFDQWGVELGKKLANTILSQLDDDDEVTNHDCSTNGLINHYKKKRNIPK
ncbi:MAG: glucose-6-phosphate isomerase [gamma proteobacterium symbiont of Bathyaustriella thionipta]|nr:glucose-6-phosphate isomerase [gamma proteobacterium symbiont of Bathyaustriella thionipta]MCU7951494.1 glucose-6-phosphate isomerase [gamma proteobacterium symbiont of Bathyaustriella thionipta]MCU7952833.1 glucose-6-phosphate isomerase [gamma proteobacterium symbiont of Bathyaustriella thionipta]MCU7958060.1 glucose-6-phosphate isomerase [gamma proteobacterium symbiont of Bathyaustriella thionipta]MCU7966329.1 glucose-6-phosphate isomerase [gamma proteobacterium symbiont of Bathyaustriella